MNEMIYLNQPLRNEIIRELYAFIAYENGKEGIVSYDRMPLVFSDKNLIKKLKPLAKKISKLGGKKIKLVKFSNFDIIEFV